MQNAEFTAGLPKVEINLIDKQRSGTPIESYSQR
jgi:hypothetical protein